MKAKTAFLAVATVAALGATLATSAAHADNVYWSVGISQPGVRVGFSNAPQVQPQRVYYPAPQVVYQPPQVVYQPPQVVYPQPQVVYPQPQVVYRAPPVIYHQPRVVYAPPVVYTGWAGPGYGHRHEEWRRHEWREHERAERRGWDRR